MPLKPTTISAYNAGLAQNKKPFLLVDEAFSDLFNTYCWRERIKRREGIRLVGRLRRCFLVAVTLTNQANGASYNVADILADAAFALRATEPNAEIEPGSFIATVGAVVFTDQGNGLLTTAGDSDGFINYATGEIQLNFDPVLGGATNVDVTFCYFPSLPVMGIRTREIATINIEQTLYFDTKYVYTYNGNDFSSSSVTEWSGTDSDFFWDANYRGATPQERLFFVTNNTNPATDPNNRIRYTSDAANWTDFFPVISGTTVTNEAAGNANGAVFNGVIANLPVIPGTVKITVENGVDPTVGFRDQEGVYPAGVLNGSANTNTGTINYTTGAFTLNFSPALTVPATVSVTYQHETTFLWQAKIIVQYYGRLLALNVWEGPKDPGTPTNPLGAVNIFNRCTFSQIGNPVQRSAWLRSTIGKGGFIDAPTNEAIVSAQFYKNTLIVFFERSTWNLRYVGEAGFPFLWERISSDFGSESTFSTVLFDKGVLAIGDKAIISSSGQGVERIDLDIPSKVFEFRNKEEGRERVQATRDFYKEVVFWTYSEGSVRKKFPNRVLLFNYRNGTWAIFRDNVTTFGTQPSPSGILWDLDIPWDSDTSWDNWFPSEFPTIVAGNHQGFVHWYQYEDAETNEDSLVNLNENESLQVTALTLSATDPVRITVPSHNLETNEVIYLVGVTFIDEATNAAVTTDLNDRFFLVIVIDDDNLDLYAWDPVANAPVPSSFDVLAYTPDPATNPTYVGNGRIALMQNMSIVTKDFNPYAAEGLAMKHSYTDFQTDSSPNSTLSVEMVVDSAFGAKGNLIVGNSGVQIADRNFGSVTGITLANPGVVTAPNHGLQTGRIITFRSVVGTTEVNGGEFTITKVSENSFSIGVDASGFTPYLRGGQWIAIDAKFYVPGSRYAWHRFYSTCYGQYLQYRLFYDNTLMTTNETHQTGFELNAMQIWSAPGGRQIQ